MLTFASMMAYCLSFIYGFALLNDDDNARTKTSDYANEFLADKNRVALKQLLSDAYVPEFVGPIMKSLYSTNSQTRTKLIYIYTLACYDFDFDYGRSFPISMHMKGHDIVASTANTQSPEVISDLWLSTILIIHPHQYRVANFLGIGLNQHTYLNWFATLNQSLFNSTTARSNTLRLTFKRLKSIHLAFKCISSKHPNYT